MGTKSQNRMVSIRHEQGQSLTAVEADKTNGVVVKSAVKMVLQLKIQKGVLGVCKQVQ